MRMVAAAAAFAALGALIGISMASAQSADRSSGPVPQVMRGVWAYHGRCDLPEKRIVVEARSVRMNGEQASASYRCDAGHCYVAWDQEYAVDVFERNAETDVLVHHTQGFHMPGEEGYARCGSKRVRVPWPPKRPR
jgi:hypothetical protein